jgi:hypothetical protein
LRRSPTGAAYAESACFDAVATDWRALVPIPSLAVLHFARPHVA